MYPGRPGRLRAFSYVGPYRYFLTFCVHQRLPRFRSPEIVRTALSQFRRASHATHFALVAYCFMPDHVHLVVCGQTDTSDLKRFIKMAKQFSGFSFTREFGQRLWQRDSYERVLRDDEATIVAVRYVFENPGMSRSMLEFAGGSGDIIPPKVFLTSMTERTAA